MQEEDFEMGINRYDNKPKEGNSNQSVPAQDNVDPKAGTPPTTEDITPGPAPTSPQQSQSDQMRAAQPEKPTNTTPQNPNDPKDGRKKVKNPAARRKAMMGCLGAFGIVMTIFIIISFVFLLYSDPNVTSPIAQLLGINQGSFINGLITFINILFILVALTVFVYTMVGLFRATMAKKEDKETKRKGLRLSLFAGIGLIVLLIVWMFSYIYLDSKRVNVGGNVARPIETVPEDTLELTAPIEIRFSAENVPINSNKYEILSHRWDFGDGEIGTNQVTSHIYKNKGTTGRYDVVLELTKRDRSTGEEVVDTYVHVVTIANEALSAIFTADPQDGEAPLTVKFDASGSSDPDGTIQRYEWDFDEDGKYDDAEGIEAEHTFEKIGRYTVGLRVVSTGNESATSEKEIVVSEKTLPEAVIEVNDNPTNYLVDEEYIFKADQSSSPNGKIEDYEWDFGDGSAPQTTKTASHTYKKAGSYEIILTVTDEEGEEGEKRLKIVVGTPAGTPVANIKTTPAKSSGALSLVGEVPFQVNFDASASTDSDGDIVDYDWDFESDGKIDAFGAQTVHTFSKVGTYTTTLRVTDSSNNIGSATISVKVEEQGIRASLEVDKASGEAPHTVRFDASGSTYPNGTISSYRWDFGDGSDVKLGSSSITHRYDKIGTFTAKVTVIGSDNSQDTEEITITVREIPLTACFTSVFKDGEAPLTTTFDPSCSTGSVSKYFWNFDDGSTSTAVKPKHTFEKAGTYTVELEVSDNDNNLATKTMTITVTKEQ